MALSGNFSQYASNETLLGLYCEWQAVQNVAGNYSDVTVTTYLKYYTIGIGQRTDHKITINGTEKSYTVPKLSSSENKQHTKYLATQTTRVNHNSDGTKSVTLSASYRFDGTYHGHNVGTITATATVTLNRIDRNPPIVLCDITNISSTGLRISASTDNTCNKWEYSLDNGSTWTQYSTSETTSAEVTINSLSPNTEYQIKVRATKKANSVAGLSAASATKTLGAAVITAANDVFIDDASQNLTIEYLVYEASYHNEIKLYLGSEELITVLSRGTTTAGQHSLTYSFSSSQRTSLLNQMTTVKEKKFTLKASSYSGNTLIATSSKDIMLKTTAANSAPTAGTVTYTDLVQRVADWSLRPAGETNDTVIVQNVSQLSVQISGFQLRNGANFDHVIVQLGDVSKYAKSGVVSLSRIGISGSFQLIYTYYDSRGYSATVKNNITVLPYSPIVFASISATRENMIGTNVQLEFSCKYSPVSYDGNDVNEITDIRYRYKRTSQEETEWSEYESIYDDELISLFSDEMSYENTALGQFGEAFTYDIEVEIQDKFSQYGTNEPVTMRTILNKGIPAIAIRNNPETGKAYVGINKPNPQAGLDIDGNIMMNGQNVMGLVNASIDDETYLSDITEAGIYFRRSTPPNDLDYPVLKIGMLEVFKVTGNLIMQRYTMRDSPWSVYMRSKVNSSWSDWKANFSHSFVDTVTPTRSYLTASSNICTLYVCGSLNSSLSSGADKFIATIPEAITPEYTVSGAAICGNGNSPCNSATVWLCGLKAANGETHPNKAKVYIRPSVNLSDNGNFEFTLVWSLNAEW